MIHCLTEKREIMRQMQAPTDGERCDKRVFHHTKQNNIIFSASLLHLTPGPSLSQVAMRSARRVQQTPADLSRVGHARADARLASVSSLAGYALQSGSHTTYKFCLSIHGISAL
jgi:hypothetical protein